MLAKRDNTLHPKRKREEKTKHVDHLNATTKPWKQENIALVQDQTRVAANLKQSQ